jgi:hypothetical protein
VDEVVGIGLVWSRFKRSLPAIISAWLLYEGVSFILSTFSYPVTGLAIGLVNALLKRALRDNIPIANYYAMPTDNYYGGYNWQYRAKDIAMGVIVSVIGIFVGLWANRRNQRQPAP